MSDQSASRRSRRTAAAIIAVLVVVIVAVVVIGLLSAGHAAPGSSAGPTAGSSSGAASSSASASSTPSSEPSVSATPLNTSTPKPAATAPRPQPTTTAALASPAPITRSLTAAVTKMEAVQGTASGPGEIAGPAVRFTITITNSTGKRVDLSNTVVNAYAGKHSDPAVPLDSPGGRPFPKSVASGASAKGVFVFNIPKADRSKVEITVDTSVLNPVVAFKGSAPS